MHRDDGLPAIEYANGDKEWYVNGFRHRIGGLPAFINSKYGSSKYISWWENGFHHRLGGFPAIESSKAAGQWYIYGIQYTEIQVINYYKILARFGRYCLKKLRMARLRKSKQVNNELLCMPPNSKSGYVGGQDFYKIVGYFNNL